MYRKEAKDGLVCKDLGNYVPLTLGPGKHSRFLLRVIIKPFLSTYFVPYTFRGAWVTSAIRTHKEPCFQGSYVMEEGKDKNRHNTYVN